VFTDIGASITRYTTALWPGVTTTTMVTLTFCDGLSAGGRVSQIYRNDSGTFTDIAAAITPVDQGSVAWGDYDNDGDLDIALSGYTGIVDGSVYIGASKVYRNDGAGVFTDSGRR